MVKCKNSIEHPPPTSMWMPSQSFRDGQIDARTEWSTAREVLFGHSLVLCSNGQLWQDWDHYTLSENYRGKRWSFPRFLRDYRGKCPGCPGGVGAYVPFLGYIHCNFCLNPLIIHGDMKENVSGCFFWTQCSSVWLGQCVSLCNRKSAVFWIMNGSAVNTALPICSLCLSCLTAEMDSSIHWTQNSFSSAKSQTTLMVKNAQPCSKSRSSSFFKLAREVSSRILRTVYSSGRALYDWGRVHRLLCWVSLFWLTITVILP